MAKELVLVHLGPLILEPLAPAAETILINILVGRGLLTMQMWDDAKANTLHEPMDIDLDDIEDVGPDDVDLQELEKLLQEDETDFEH